MRIKVQHELKILPVYFHEVLTGNKVFEIRQNDRDFKKGDTVVLKEFEYGVMGDPGGYSGREIRADIGYVCDYEQKPNTVVFSLLNVRATP